MHCFLKMQLKHITILKIHHELAEAAPTPVYWFKAVSLGRLCQLLPGPCDSNFGVKLWPFYSRTHLHRPGILTQSYGKPHTARTLPCLSPGTLSCHANQTGFLHLNLGQYHLKHVNKCWNILCSLNPWLQKCFLFQEWDSPPTDTFIQPFASVPETVHDPQASFLFSLPHSLCLSHTRTHLTFSLLIYKLFLPQQLCTCWISSTSLPSTHSLGFISKSPLSQRQLLTNPAKATPVLHIPMPSRHPL